jgi:uncharacterized membrane protein YdjX (TVP38/TMEM64 family)
MPPADARAGDRHRAISAAPMSLQHWLLYLSVVLAVILTPGPSAALCLTHGARHGVWRATATVLGGMVASLTLMTLSALGLGAAITASTTLPRHQVRRRGLLDLPWHRDVARAGRSGT